MGYISYTNDEFIYSLQFVSMARQLARRCHLE